MSAYQLLVVGLACLAAALIGALLLWLDARLDRWTEDDRQAYAEFVDAARSDIRSGRHPW